MRALQVDVDVEERAAELLARHPFGNEMKRGCIGRKFECVAILQLANTFLAVSQRGAEFVEVALAGLERERRQPSAKCPSNRRMMGPPSRYRAWNRASAIRYYEQIGILAPARRVSGQRRYDETVLYRLAVVRRAQEAGFTLEEIRRLFFGFSQNSGLNVGRRSRNERWSSWMQGSNRSKACGRC